VTVFPSVVGLEPSRGGDREAESALGRTAKVSWRSAFREEETSAQDAAGTHSFAVHALNDYSELQAEVLTCKPQYYTAHVAVMNNISSFHSDGRCALCPGIHPDQGSTPMVQQTSPVMLTVAEICQNYRIGRTKLFELIREGRLDARKMGRRTLIPARALDALMDSLPRARGGR
jgi:excisionase family DNA binding protein